MNIPERLLILKQRLEEKRREYLQTTIGERPKVEHEAKVIKAQIDVFEKILNGRKNTP